jgi:flagellar biosynthesis component FlhA
MRYNPDVLYIAAALSPAAGLLLPLPERLIDIGWVCSLSLTASLIIICLLAKNTSQLHGFAPLLASTILLRLFLTAASLKFILRSASSPALIALLGNKFTQADPVPAVLASAILLAGCLSAVFRFAPAMRRAAFDFAARILPLKRAGLQADLGLQVISRQQAQNLLEKIRSESRLFASFAVSSVLLRIESAAAAFLLPALLALKVFYASGQSQWLPQDAAAILSYGAGLACLLFIPAALSAWACASLTSREKLSLQAQPADSKEQNLAKVHIVSHNTGKTEQVELLNPDFATRPAAAKKNDENIVDFEPPAAVPPCPPVQSLPQDSPEKYFDALYQLLDAAFAQKTHRPSWPRNRPPSCLLPSRSISPFC